MTPTWTSDDGRVVLYHGDCRDIIPHVKADAVITDPPYGIERFKKGFGTTRFKGFGAEKNGLTWDKKPNATIFEQLFEIGSTRIIWGANNFDLPASECFLVWDKEQTVDNFAGAELAFCDAKGVTAKVCRYGIHKHNHAEKFHPTQKPVAVMKWCMDVAKVPHDAVVFDPYMGSGTTAIACIRTGRRFIGVEIDASYFEIAKQRIIRELAQPMIPGMEPHKQEQGVLI